MEAFLKTSVLVCEIEKSNKCVYRLNILHGGCTMLWLIIYKTHYVDRLHLPQVSSPPLYDAAFMSFSYLCNKDGFNRL